METLHEVSMIYPLDTSCLFWFKMAFPGGWSCALLTKEFHVKLCIHGGRHVGAPILRNVIGKTRTDCQMMLALQTKTNNCCEHIVQAVCWGLFGRISCSWSPIKTPDYWLVRQINECGLLHTKTKHTYVRANSKCRDSSPIWITNKLLLKLKSRADKLLLWLSLHLIISSQSVDHLCCTVSSHLLQALPGKTEGCFWW